jgi:hypothetical protein
MCTGLNPEFNLWNQLAPYAMKMAGGEGGSDWKKWIDEIGEVLKTLVAIPGRAERVLGRVERGELNVQMPMVNIQISYLERSLNRLTGGVIFLALLVSGATLYDSNSTLGQVLMGGSALALFYTVFMVRRRRTF